MLLVVAWLGAFVVQVRDYGWDDGAITEAYARTFADTGRIALTPYSVVGEGFSSPAWFLVLAMMGALARPFGGLGYPGFIAVGQWLAVLCAGMGAALLVALLRRRMGVLAAVGTAVVAFAGAGMVNEAMNGMEMLLLSLVAVALLVAVRRPDSVGVCWLTGLSFLVPFVRLEALAYLAAMGLALAVRRRWRTVMIMAASSAVGLGVVTGARWLIFGQLVPNTMIAKRWPPYTWVRNQASTPWNPEMVKELLAAWLPILALLLLTVLCAGLLRAQGRARQAAGSDERFRPPDWTVAACGWVVGCTVANVMIGPNWGYRTRMELSMIPVGIAAAAVLAAGVLRTVSPAPRASRLPRASGALVLAVPVVVAVVIAAQFGSILMRSGHLSAARAGSEQRSVTPHSYRTTGEAVDRVRVLLGEQSLAFMVPDVGGSSLCCTRLNIIDSALLTNPELARVGWGGFDAYLVQVAPDVIETHSPWSDASGIYHSSFFASRYRPIVINDRFVYLRTDLLDRLRARCAVRSLADTASAWYRGGEPDESYLAASGFEVCVLS